MTTPPPGQWPPPQPPRSGPPPEPQGHQSTWHRGQGEWGQQHSDRRRPDNVGKWVLGGLAVLVIIVVTTLVTTLVLRGSDTRKDPTAAPLTSASPVKSDVASAKDDGPVTVITQDPTCEAWMSVVAGFAHASDGGWNTRDPKIPATQWTSELRNQYQAVEAAMLEASQRTIDLAKQTPHRVMRILYEQFAAYSRAYIDRLPSYREPDDHLVRVAIGFSTGLNAICDSIAFGVAGARAPLVPGASAPHGIDRDPRPEDAQIFLNSPSSICDQWLSSAKRFTDDTAAWRTVDPNVSSADLNADQRMINAEVAPIMEKFATETQLMGLQSGNGAWADVATLSAQYRRAYVSALLTYVPADNNLQIAAGSLTGAISEACRAAGY
ncbi:hypothetical protein ACNUDN_00156 [Mycobacterium sp. smrl_JER01]